MTTDNVSYVRPSEEAVQAGTALRQAEPDGVGGHRHSETTIYVVPDDRPEWVRRATEGRLPVKDFTGATR